MTYEEVSEIFDEVYARPENLEHGQVRTWVAPTIEDLREEMGPRWSAELLDRPGYPLRPAVEIGEHGDIVAHAYSGQTHRFILIRSDASPGDVAVHLDPGGDISTYMTKEMSNAAKTVLSPEEYDEYFDEDGIIYEWRTGDFFGPRAKARLSPERHAAYFDEDDKIRDPSTWDRYWAELNAVKETIDDDSPWARIKQHEKGLGA